MAACSLIARKIAEAMEATREKYAPEGVHPDTMAEEIAASLGLVQFYAVDYGGGEMSELTWEHWDEARDHAAEVTGDDLGDSRIVTGWFTGWQPAESPVSTT